MSSSLNVTKVTPIEVVEAIEPLLELWEGRLGFTKTVSVPDGDRLGFTILVRGASEVMLQTRRSLAADLPAVAAREPRSLLYMEVESLDAAVRALAGVEVLVGPRTTFYGARELFVASPSGHVIGFSEHMKETTHA